LLFGALRAQSPDNVLVVVNQSSALSRTVGEYYVMRRHVPLANLCRINAPTAEEIPRTIYDKQIAGTIATYLRSKRLAETILFIVTTAGVPLRVAGSGEGMMTTTAAVDSELALLYSDLHGPPHRLPGPIPNPFFNSTAAFIHPRFLMYLVTRLAGYDFADIKGLVDRALAARNIGKFVIDLKALDGTSGNDWLRDAAERLPKDRVILDETNRVLLHERGVIGYAGWGSNDPQRKQRYLGFEWLPGAIMTEFVSFNARTFAMPPKEWTIGTWNDQRTYFAGSPQDLAADYIHEGVTGTSGHVFEPYLQLTPRPDLLLPAYYSGRTLAESYYLAIPALSWQNIVVGDPLCSLGKP
jgi:uncharacterized protein (TIGR03790 family)